MVKYRCLHPLRTDDGQLHKVGDVVDLSNKEAQAALSFRSVQKAPVLKKADPVTQPVEAKQPETPKETVVATPKPAAPTPKAETTSIPKKSAEPADSAKPTDKVDAPKAEVKQETAKSDAKAADAK